MMIQVIQIMIIVIKPGQKLEDKQVEALAALPSDASFLQKLLVKHRRLIGDIFSKNCSLKVDGVKA